MPKLCSLGVDPESPRSNPLEILIAGERYDRIEQFLDSLPTEEKLALVSVARVPGSPSVAVLAARLGRSRNYVYAAARRAARKAARALQNIVGE